MKENILKSKLFKCAILILVLFLSFCAQKNRSITIVYYAMPSTFDPHLRKEIVTISILSNIYEPLVTFDANMKLIPALAEYWEKLDSLTWRFYLRKNVKFHDNRQFTPADVIYSFYRPFRLLNSEYNQLKGHIDTILAEGEDKILIRLKSPHAILLFDIASLFIVPADYDTIKNKFCGTGPYKVVKIDKDQIDLRRFANYWNNKVDIDNVRILFVPDIEKRIEMLKNKDVDIITLIPFTHLERVKEAGRLVTTPGVATRWLEMDLKRFPFNRIEFRQALNLAINRDRLVNEVYHSLAVPANQFISQGLFGFDYNLPQFVYAPDSARRLLKRLGNLPEIEFDFAESRALIARAIIEDLEKIGLRIKANSLPVEKYWEKIEKRKSGFYLIGGVPLTNEGMTTLRSKFHTCEPDIGMGMLNYSGYSNKELDQLIEDMISNTDLRSCVRLLLDAQKILLNTLPEIPLVWEKEVYGVSDRIEWNPRLNELIIVKEIKFKNEKR